MNIPYDIALYERWEFVSDLPILKLQISNFKLMNKSVGVLSCPRSLTVDRNELLVTDENNRKAVPNLDLQYLMMRNRKWNT